LPWVVERPGTPEAPRLRWFAVDCPPLGRRQLWLLTGALGGIAADEFGVHVVLPTPAADRLAHAGEGSLFAPVGGRHHLVSVRLDETERAETARLERILLLGYEASLA
jgi:hypothetical protein